LLEEYLPNLPGPSAFLDAFFSSSKIGQLCASPIFWHAMLQAFQMHALSQRHPLAAKLLEHFSKCLRCTCRIYQLAPHSLQSVSLRSLASDFVYASFSKEVQISSIIWLYQSVHLAPDTSTICFNFPPFSVVPVK
jgi:hypothetical protein